MKSNWFSRVFLMLLSFAFLGGLCAALIAPRLITWYAEPAVDMGFNCSSTAAWAANTLLKWQLWGSLAGAALGFVAVFLFSRKKPKGTLPTP